MQIDAVVGDYLEAYLAEFDSGSKKQQEKKKCVTVQKSPFFKYVVRRCMGSMAFYLGGHRAMEARLHLSMESELKTLTELEDERRQHVEQQEKSNDGMEKLNKIVEQYQLNRISTMPRSEHRAVEAENAKLLAELQVLHEKCWNFDMEVAKECSRLGIRQKSGRKKKPENQPQCDPFVEPRLAAEATKVLCSSPQIKILVKRRHVNSPPKKSPTKKARSASGIPDLYQ